MDFQESSRSPRRGKSLIKQTSSLNARYCAQLPVAGCRWVPPFYLAKRQRGEKPMSSRRILRIAVSICAFALPVAMDAQAPSPEALGQAAAAAGRFQDAFRAYLNAIQSLPEPAPPADE